MVPKWISIGVFQVFLPVGFVIAVPIQFLLFGSSGDAALRQVANGSLMVPAVILCFSTWAETSHVRGANGLAWATFLMGIIGVILLVTLTGPSSWAEICSQSLSIDRALAFNGVPVRSGSCNSLGGFYPNVPGMIGIIYMVSVWGWMYYTYRRAYSDLT